MKSSLDKIFYKIVYHQIIYMCDFLMNLYNFFAVVCTDFHEIVVCTRYVPYINRWKDSIRSNILLSGIFRPCLDLLAKFFGKGILLFRSIK